MMTANGLNKLMEECGELVQIAAKKAAYMNTDIHPDDKGSMAQRMTDEMGDVTAAILFVAYKLNLDPQHIDTRAKLKMHTFLKWDAEG